MLKTINILLDDFISLFFPKLCLACDSPLPSGEPHLCLDCQLNLPLTDFHLQPDNAFTARFEGRLPVAAAAALFYFTKKSKTQHLIHQLKYNDKREVAVALGRMLGSKIAYQPQFKIFDLIVPVPMHPAKEQLRGYNQAALFAQGLSETLHIPLEVSVLKKIKITDTQTHKSRLDRFANIADAFALATPSVVKDKKVLLVDDVMTTGATLEACALPILADNPTTKFGFATIAFAR